MFKKILVGTDGSDTASKAVAHAVELAKRMGAELIISHSYAPPKGDVGAPFGPSEPFPGIEVGKSILKDVEKRFGGDVQLRSVLREGEPGDVLVDVAEEEGIDLLIVGNKGMTGAKRFVLGSVPNTVSHHAPCSVMIVNTTGGKDVGMYKRVLAATDGSSTAGHAARVAAEIAKAAKAKLTLVYVGDSKEGEQTLAQAAKSLSNGVKVETRVKSGDPADKIIEAAEDESSDLIVVGNKGMTGAKRFLLGSVPNQVSHHAPCHVLIVKTT
jgi:nucleotide-binding universal stress UspA family protein